jgi:arylsulfatase A-like enzyme
MRTRKRTLVTLLALSISATLVGSVLIASSIAIPGCFERSSSHPTSAGLPNILVIVTDDQRQGLAVMPETRRLFRRGGTDFKNAFVSDPLCCPSRASIFTGQYPHNHQVETEEEPTNLAQGSTVQHYLQDAGYCTSAFGKYLNSWPISRRPPNFDISSIFTASAQGYRNTLWNVNGEIGRVPDYSTGYISRGARAFLRAANYSSDPRPWFLYLATAAPHFPYTSARKYANVPVPKWQGDAGTSERNRSDKPRFVTSKKRISLRRGKYIQRRQYRTLIPVDDMVGRIFKELKRYHEDRNTLALFTSDNGFLWGEHGVRGKELPYTEAVHVPLLARWPGHVPGGDVDRHLVSNVDIAPTIMEAAGLRPDPRYPMDGRSLLDRTERRKMVLTEYFNDPHFPKVKSWASLRTNRYSYTEYYDGTNVVFREYYQLNRDPGELHNVLSDGDPKNNGRVERLSALLRLARRCTGRTCP